MKYIKTFEKKERLTVGKYVICIDFSMNQDGRQFIKNKIGQIVKIYIDADNPYCVFYENIPDVFKRYFYKSSNIDDFNHIVENYGYRWFTKDEILHFSSNKKELEILLIAKKYNL